MVRHAVDGILKEDIDKRLSAKYDTSGYQEHDNIKYVINKTELYEIYKLSLDDSHKE